MKEERSDYHAFTKSVDLHEDTMFKRSLIDEPGDIYPGCEHHFDLLMLFEIIFKKLHPLFSIDCGALVLYDKGLSKIVKSYLSEYSIAEGRVCSATISNPVSLSMITTQIAEFGFPVLKSRENWIDESGENHYPHNSTENYLFHCYIPLEINNEILGTLELHNHDKELSAEGLTFCCNIADLLAELIIAANNQPEEPAAAVHPHTNSDSGLLVSLSHRLSLVSSTKEILQVIREYMMQVFGFTYLEILQECGNDKKHIILQSLFRETTKQPASGSFHQDAPIAIDEVLAEFSSFITTREIAVDGMENRGWTPDYINMLKSNGIQTLMAAPLRAGNEFLGVLLTGSDRYHTLTHDQELLMQGISSQFALALGNVLASDRMKSQLEELNSFRQKMEQEQLYQQEEIQMPGNYDDIIGNSKAMQQVFNMLTNVAGSETTVLILGETGTGKELIAKAIHNDSERKGNQMIKVNCAAIPPNLIESELFGHEKGSFTGATERRIGKFELADKSTLFLDEIGELSLELQVKLLRVLQEKEIERVGGKTTITTDVRIVSATNRNLMEEVEAGRFRSDLFYRLNVFPISLPPLRKRKEDIPLLAGHFLSRFTSKSGKKIDGFSQKVLSDLMKYSWPGNIRELEHLIERQVLLTKGPVMKELELPADTKVMVVDGTEFAPIKTITQNERDHIFAVLQLCNGKISGKDGAAKLLAVPATTLNSKIKRLGLAKKHIV